ncbi:hypothetical protein FIBSPDRAFT_969813 [Athelia psychrophila]|uniref:Vps52 C-terminal domain-containing protein n=1 Tax=Athelia psychrophila TaxID=1759441 RepID=A0A167T614_9AGAM|nr:hypothetical protein FIBSPDRAFT_969813 [Fibularhizoctonia sp. CBS 109695]
MFSPTSMLSPSRGVYEDRSISGSDAGYSPQTPRARVDSFATSVNLTPRPQNHSQSVPKTDRSVLDSIWKQVMDPILEYCQIFVKSTLDPAPPLISLLTMIRLVEDVVTEVQRRNCPPLENYVFALRLQMWPVFQKAISEQIEALKKLAEGTTAGYFGRAVSTTDLWVSSISHRYVALFNSFVALTEQVNETMIFSNLLRLRQELTKLLLKHTESIKDFVAKATSQSTLYEGILQGLSKGTHLATHPQWQKEISYWKEKEEEARRRIVSANQRARR